MTSVCISRLMLSIQSLAAGLQVEPTWLLSHAEMSRLRWRQGAHEGEMIVEIETIEVPDQDGELELRTRAKDGGTDSQSGDDSLGCQSPKVFMSVVGQYDDLASRKV